MKNRELYIKTKSLGFSAKWAADAGYFLAALTTAVTAYSLTSNPVAERLAGTFLEFMIVPAQYFLVLLALACIDGVFRPASVTAIDKQVGNIVPMDKDEISLMNIILWTAILAGLFSLAFSMLSSPKISEIATGGQDNSVYEQQLAKETDNYEKGLAKLERQLAEAKKTERQRLADVLKEAPTQYALDTYNDNPGTIARLSNQKSNKSIRDWYIKIEAEKNKVSVLEAEITNYIKGGQNSTTKAAITAIINGNNIRWLNQLSQNTQLLYILMPLFVFGAVFFRFVYSKWKKATGYKAKNEQNESFGVIEIIIRLVGLAWSKMTTALAESVDRMEGSDLGKSQHQNKQVNTSADGSQQMAQPKESGDKLIPVRNPPPTEPGAPEDEQRLWNMERKLDFLLEGSRSQQQVNAPTPSVDISEDLVTQLVAAIKGHPEFANLEKAIRDGDIQTQRQLDMVVKTLEKNPVNRSTDSQQVNATPTGYVDQRGDSGDKKKGSTLPEHWLNGVDGELFWYVKADGERNEMDLSTLRRNLSAWKKKVDDMLTSIKETTDEGKLKAKKRALTNRKSWVVLLERGEELLTNQK